MGPVTTVTFFKKGLTEAGRQLYNYDERTKGGGDMARRMLTEAEEKIMEVLWEKSPRTMMEITHALEAETGWSKHTVTTLLKRMLQKQTISMDGTGPVRQYAPCLSKDEVAREQTQSLLKRMFAGKASLLVENLVEDGSLSQDDLRELLSVLEQKT